MWWTKAFPWTLFGDHDHVLCFVSDVCVVQSRLHLQCFGYWSKWVCSCHRNSSVRVLLCVGRGACCGGLQNKLQGKKKAFGLQNWHWSCKCLPLIHSTCHFLPTKAIFFKIKIIACLSGIRLIWQENSIILKLGIFLNGIMTLTKLSKIDIVETTQFFLFNHI